MVDLTRVKSWEDVFVTMPGTETRSRILEAAWALVGERGTTGGVTVAGIAAAAGVSRQLVYFHFENRVGLLAAMARHHDSESGFAGRVAASRSLPPEEGLEELLRAWFGYVPEILPVARALEAAEVTGDEGGAAWRDRMDDLREAFRIAVERVDRDGRLSEGWTVEAASDWVWARSHLANWQHLVAERGWSPDDYERLMVRSILGEVLARTSAVPGRRRHSPDDHRMGR
jgi:AcrR family transcriptional regulator